MFGAFLTLIKTRVRREVNSAATKAVFACVTAAFLFLGAAGLLLSLYIALEPSLGELRAALSVSGVAIVVALLTSTPLWWPRRRPPPAPSPSIPQLLALASLTSGRLSARQLAIGGALLAVAIGAAAVRSPPKR